MRLFSCSPAFGEVGDDKAGRSVVGEGSAGALFPIVSDFEHDDLLRVTSVRHWRDDTAVPGLGQYRLLGRYDYSYDQNSMML